MNEGKKIRQDGWSAEEDQLLAETVLKHIRGGSTQLTAFEEVGNQLNRTSAACGFRWNSTIRKLHEEAIKEAKQARKQLKKKRYIIKSTTEEEASASVRSQSSFESFPGKNPNFSTIMEYLRQYFEDYKKLQKEVEVKNNIIRELQEELNLLKQELKNPQDTEHEANDDYKTLIKILDRARKMSILS